MSILKSIDIAFKFPVFFHEYTVRHMQDSVQVFISSFNMIIFPASMLILFINHFIINFTGKESKAFININKIIVVIIFICLIVDKCSMHIVNMLKNADELININ